jgi:hypothetical protein
MTMLLLGWADAAIGGMAEILTPVLGGPQQPLEGHGGSYPQLRPSAFVTALADQLAHVQSPACRRSLAAQGG